ncbi:MAG: spore cortex biosynthesis protein YabQ [Lachnospiraceae bacterium]|nr:spore cortex biosynthesis protein YabQ [Lachnospiraceae bacterium]
MADLIYDEAHLFMICLSLGALLAMIYDAVRILRLLFRHKDWLVDIEDLIYWIFTAGLVFRTLFRYNQGVLRGYAFLGMFLGVVLYLLTLSGLLLRVIKCILPYWEKMKFYWKRPFVVMAIWIRKALKNIVSQVTMAIKGR